MWVWMCARVKSLTVELHVDYTINILQFGKFPEDRWLIDSFDNLQFRYLDIQWNTFPFVCITTNYVDDLSSVFTTAKRYNDFLFQFQLCSLCIYMSLITGSIKSHIYICIHSFFLDRTWTFDYLWCMWVVIYLQKNGIAILLFWCTTCYV